MNILTITKQLVKGPAAGSFVLARNKSAGTRYAGDVVVIDPSTSTASEVTYTTTTSADDKAVLGMVLETTARYAVGKVQRGGVTAKLKVNGTVAIVAGDYLSTYTSAGIAAKATAGKGGVFAVALEGYAVADSAGVIDAWLFGPPRIDSSGAAIGVVGNMAAAGTSTANSIGVGTTAASIDHVHALGAHDHSGATKGGAVAMGAVGSMAAAGTATANAAGTGTAPAAIDHAHALGDHDHSGATKGSAIALAALGSNFFSADANGRAKFAAGLFDVTTFQSVVAAAILSATVTGRAFMATDYFNAAHVATAFATNSFDAANCLDIFADNAIPGSKVNWSYGATASTITPDDSASAGVAATVSRSDHVHANTCAAPSAGLGAADAEGAASTFARSNHVHKATVADAVDFSFGNSDDVLVRWSTGDASNHAFVVALGASMDMHITDATNVATDWNVTGHTNPTLSIHCATNPATDYVSISVDGTTATIQAVGNTLDLTAVGVVTVNEASADVDFRVETNGMAYAIYSDGLLDALVLGSNTNTAAADQLITISRAARANTAATNYYDVAIQPAGAITTTGVTGVVATLYVAEPNITIGANSVTVAATVYIASAPTEGGANHALYVASGTAYFAGLITAAAGLTLSSNQNITVAGSADLVMAAATAAALEISDGTTKLLAFDSRATTDNVVMATITGTAPTFASANGTTYSVAKVAAITATLTDGTGVTAMNGIGLYIDAPTVTSAAATTVALASTLYVAAPVAAGAGPASFTASYAGHFAAGIRVDGNLSMANAAYDLIMKANTAAALEVSDGTTKLLTFDTRNTVTGVSAVTVINAGSQTLPDGANTWHRLVNLTGYTATLAGATQVTTAMDGMMLYIGAATVNQSGGAVTVDKASSVYITAIAQGADVTITAKYMIDTSVAGCFLTNAGVWTDASGSMHKTNIKPLDNSRLKGMLAQVAVKSYNRIDPSDGGFERFGLIAEEVPDFLATPNHDGVAPGYVAGFALAGVKWLEERVTALEAKVG